MKISQETEELQEKLVSLIAKIDDICRKHDVTYYLFAGSLIGALRHHGFIPWDDDVDIIMTRNNWNKFKEAFEIEKPDGMAITSLDFDSDLGMPINHFTDTNTSTIYRYHLANPEVAGVVIDIEILDPIPNDKEAWYQYIEDVEELQDFTTTAYYYALRKLKNPGTSTRLKENYKLAEEKGSRYVVDNIVEKLSQYDEDECDYLVQRFGAAPIVYPKELYGEPRYVDFGKYKFPIPRYAEEVLFIAYGSWMNLPRYGSTLSSHNFSTRSFCIPSEVYFDKFYNKYDQKFVRNTYRKRKLVYENHVEELFKSEVNTDEIKMHWACMHYKEKLSNVDLATLLSDRDYDALADLFNEYIELQCSETFSGSPSVTGWKRWYRRNSPLLIDIGDDAISAAVRLLLRNGDISRAWTVLKARLLNEKELSKELSITNDIFTATREAIMRFYNCEYDACEKIVDNYLAKFEDNFSLWFINFKLGIMAEKIDIADELEKGIKLFPLSVELKGMKAEYLLDTSKFDDAKEILSYLLKDIDNGIVLNSLKNKLKEVCEKEVSDEELYSLYLFSRERLCETLNIEEETILANYLKDTFKTEQKRDENSSVNGPLAVRFKLLSEIDEICANNDIKYTVCGQLLLQIAGDRKVLNPNTDISIAMYAEDAHKFLKYFETHTVKDRFLNCMFTNENDTLFDMTYCDTSTLELTFNRLSEQKYSGIGIRIFILRSKQLSKFANFYNRVLEIGWRQQFTGEIATKKQKLTYVYVNLLTKVLGKKRTAKKIFNRLIKSAYRDNSNSYFIGPFRKNDGELLAKYYRERTKISAYGYSFYVPQDIRLSLVSSYGAGIEKLCEINTNNKVVDDTISYEDFIAFLKDKGIDCYEIGRYNLKALVAKNEAAQYNDLINSFWRYMVSIGNAIRKVEILTSPYDC